MATEKINYKEWDKDVTPETNKQVEEAEKNGGVFEKVPYDTYIVNVKNIELKYSSKDQKMLSIQFSIIEGPNGDEKYKNRIIFYNKIVESPNGIHFANEFLRSLDSGVEIVWTGKYSDWNNTLMDILEATSKKLEYQLNYSENKKGFDEYKIEEVFEV